MYLYIVLGGYIRILGAPSVQSYSPNLYLLPTVYLFMADIANPDLIVCSCRTWICFDINRLYEEQRQQVRMAGLPKNGKFKYMFTDLKTIKYRDETDLE